MVKIQPTLTSYVFVSPDYCTELHNVSVVIDLVWLNGLVVSAHGIRTRGPRFDSRVAPLFHWLATLASCLLTLHPQFLSS